ncbi:MAG TPA: hypothetical protein VJS14_10845 [Enterobacteriaceae bacterium]|nr:hypothetical protein [Enterobacteriaceae bacterium]
MANADSNMNIYSEPLADIHYSVMAGALVNISFDNMALDECLLLANCCDRSRAGLCHCIAVLGEVLNEEEVKPEQRCQLKHSLTTISQLIPALTDLSHFLHADLRSRKLALM